MRRSTILTLLLLPSLLVFGTTDLKAQEANLDGRWKILWETSLGEAESFTVKLEEDGAMLEGTAEIPREFFTDQAGTGENEIEITDGGIHDDRLTFKVEFVHPHHELMDPPSESMAGVTDTHTIAVYAAVRDGVANTELRGYLTGVMPDQETAVPFVAIKR